MKHNYLVIFLAFFNIMILQGQEVILLQGKVLNDTIELSNLHVVNMTLEHGTVTTGSGDFTIKTRLNDVINISAVQYESRQFIVDEKVFKRGSISLYLIPKITELDEVNISNIELSGDLGKDVKSTTYAATITAKELGLPQNTGPIRTVEERRYYAATAGAGPVGMLINAISGRTKMLKKHLEVSRLQAKIDRNKSKFSTAFYVDDLKIPEELIEDFVFFVFEDPEVNNYLRVEAIFNLLELMKAKAPVYLKLKNSEVLQISN